MAPPVATKRHLKGAFCDDDVAFDVKSNAVDHNKVRNGMKGAPEMGAKMGRVWSTISSHMTTAVDDDAALNELDKEYLLRVAHTQVWQVYDLLCRLSDAVTSDVNNLPLQVLCRVCRRVIHLSVVLRVDVIFLSLLRPSLHLCRPFRTLTFRYSLFSVMLDVVSCLFMTFPGCC